MLLIYVAATVTDIRSRTIPNVLPLLLIVAGTLHCLINGYAIIQPVINCILTLSLFMAISFVGDYILKKKQKGGEHCCFGGGDIKLISATAFVAGINATLIIVLISQLAVLAYTLFKKIRGKQTVSSVPLAPFLLFGLIALFTLIYFKGG